MTAGPEEMRSLKEAGLLGMLAPEWGLDSVLYRAGLTCRYWSLFRATSWELKIHYALG